MFKSDTNFIVSLTKLKLILILFCCKKQVKYTKCKLILIPNYTTFILPE